jgi:hypothetical protein
MDEDAVGGSPCGDAQVMGGPRQGPVEGRSILRFTETSLIFCEVYEG